jgi:S-(hydroxymethyl)glutathione dehydrogenase/alcohol dehydrogenase
MDAGAAATTRAVVLTALRQPLALVDGVRIPALKDGQVLVDIAYTGVCRSQLMEARGLRGEDRFLPHMLGHEASGRVRAVGATVTKVRPGDLVILTWIRGQGQDAGGTQYAGADGPINAGGVTTFSERAVVSENRVVKVPDGVPLKAAVLFGCALPTGAGLVLNELQPRPGTSIAVFGLGGIGLCALMACRLHDFTRIVAVDVAAAKLALARELGAHATIDASREDPVAAIRAQTAGRGVDYAIEASGRCSVIEQAFESTCTGHGTTIFASHPPAGEKIRLDPHALISGKRIRGSWGGGCDPDADFPRYAAHYRAGRLPLDRLTQRTYRLDQINEALDDLEAGRVDRPIVEVNPHV